MSSAATEQRGRRVAAIYRQLAQRDAERAQLQLELAALLEEGAAEEPAPKKAKAPRRLVVIRPPALEPSAGKEPSELDMKRAEQALRRVGYRRGAGR